MSITHDQTQNIPIGGKLCPSLNHKTKMSPSQNQFLWRQFSVPKLDFLVFPFYCQRKWILKSLLLSLVSKLFKLLNIWNNFKMLLIFLEIYKVFRLLYACNNMEWCTIIILSYGLRWQFLLCGWHTSVAKLWLDTTRPSAEVMREQAFIMVSIQEQDTCPS